MAEVKSGINNAYYELRKEVNEKVKAICKKYGVVYSPQLTNYVMDV
ncbi:MAG: hypothetical protein NC822_07555 [Candidatus Omnitrophica bacterium]|nr:hypothetical protein [Candidatus Omnitrophota bacterium]MCM8827158.1 hypothetical protein [Candidatus Omnitrophota bacterium]